MSDERDENTFIQFPYQKYVGWPFEMQISALSVVLYFLCHKLVVIYNIEYILMCDLLYRNSTSTNCCTMTMSYL